MRKYKYAELLRIQRKKRIEEIKNDKKLTENEKKKLVTMILEVPDCEFLI